ncbi:MAG TPA: hypothetical protein VGX72_09710 [Solirubrobacteraceae bacterium]|jgi:hypothetical protein|nr:hypothetical protein [Solirubrobacteraceae bacterium]
MARKRSEGREHEPGGEHEPGPEAGPDPERRPGYEADLGRIGPLAIARHVKDDGRALILYSEQPRAEQERPPA